MYILLRVWLYILLTFGYFWVSVGRVWAVEYFSDTFSRFNVYDNWVFGGGGDADESSWSISGGELVGRVSTTQFSYLFPGVDIRFGDYALEADIKSLSGVDLPVLVRVSDNKSDYYQIDFRSNDPGWPQDNNNITLYRISGRGRNFALLDSYPSPRFPRIFDITQDVVHKVKIILDGRRVRVYFDGNLSIDHYDSRPDYFSAGGVGLLNWGGNFGGLTTNHIDNIRVLSLDHVDPTPTVEPRNKVIVIPGLGASWNKRAMVNNEAVGDDEWRMIPFVAVYDGLISALEGKGLVRNSDFYVWNYDWRRPIAEISGKLGNFIDDRLSAGEEVDLVGHSLGGLVARDWAQTDGNLDKLGKLVTLGSPHSGTVKAYDAWNGAKFGEQPDAASIALNVLLQLQKKNGRTKVETVRNYAPVIKDLLPTFDFAKRYRAVVSLGQLESWNQYLAQKNLTINSIFDYLKAMVGTGSQTKEWVNLGDRTVFDKMLGIWPDGRPVSYNFGDGDGTVLKKSGKIEGDVFGEISASHTGLPNKSISLVLSELGLGSGVDIALEQDFSNSLVFFMGSPATMRVRCDGGNWVDEDEMGFVLMKNQNYTGCELAISADSDGIYHLVTGRSDKEDSWRYVEEEINEGEERTLFVEAAGGSPGLNEQTLDYYYELIRRDISLLMGSFESRNLVAALATTDRRDSVGILENLLRFRKEKAEIKITNRILDNLEVVIAVGNREAGAGTVKALRNKVWQSRSVADGLTRLYGRRGITPGVAGATNYSEAETRLNLSGGVNNAWTVAKLTIAQRQFQYVW